MVTPQPREDGEEQGSGRSVEDQATPDWDEMAFPDGEDDNYRYVSVPPIESGKLGEGPIASLYQQVQELYGDFTQNVATNDDAFRQFMLWAAETDSVTFQDLLIATRSVYDIMGVKLPGNRTMWNEFRDMANLVEITTVSDSELEYALEVFSKTFDLYKAELRRMNAERSMAEELSTRRISEEILAEDESLLSHGEAEGEEEEEREEQTDLPEPPATVEMERWDKLVDDTRSKINSTKAEFDDLVEDLLPHKEERDAALSRLRVLEKDTNRKHERLDFIQRGRISEAKAEEVQNLEREMVRIVDEESDWSSRLSIAQERIDERIGLCQEKHTEFSHIKREVNSLLSNLPLEEREAVRNTLTDELGDLDKILAEATGLLAELSAEDADLPDDSTAIMDSVPSSPEGTGPPDALTLPSESVERAMALLDGSSDESPVVFKDIEVMRTLSELPMERPPEEALLLRIESLQQEMINRENAIMELEHTVEKLMEDKEGSATAVELERNKVKLDLVNTQEDLSESQGLLEQYLDVIKTLESQMEHKDRELRKTLAMNRRKTDELRQKEAALEALERELLEKQEEFRSERQELQDRETRLNSQIEDRELKEREIAKKDLTLELRNEQIRKKMDRLTTRELTLQRENSKVKELEEMLSLKERELQSLKTELDVREDEMRRREGAIEDRSSEAKKLQSEVSKMEHRIRTRDETLRRREAHTEEEEARFGRLEVAIAAREAHMKITEEGLILREAEVEGIQESIESQRDAVDALRREVTEERAEVERLRISQEHRYEEMLRREDQFATRETTLVERERAAQLREERLGLERSEIDHLREEFDEIERKWSAKEKNLLEQLGNFNSEKQDLLEDWKAAKRRVRELETDRTRLSASLVGAEGSLMTKDEEILHLTKEIDKLTKNGKDGGTVELGDGVKVSLKRVMEDMERHQVEMSDLKDRASKVGQREKELIEMEEILHGERERVRELLAEQEKGRTELKEALDQLSDRTAEVGEEESSLAELQKAHTVREDDLSQRERTLREREHEVERLTSAVRAEARAEDREEELTDLQREMEARTIDLERREEELQATRTRLEEERSEVERQKGELMLARENLLQAQGELVEVPPPIGIRSSKAREPTPDAGDDEPKEELLTRGPGGLAMKAAEMAAAADKLTEMGVEDDTVEVPGAVSRSLEPSGTPLARLRCKVCDTIIPIFTNERPLQIICPNCGKGGTLK